MTIYHGFDPESIVNFAGAAGRPSRISPEVRRIVDEAFTLTPRQQTQLALDPEGAIQEGWIEQALPLLAASGRHEHPEFLAAIGRYTLKVRARLLSWAAEEGELQEVA